MARVLLLCLCFVNEGKKSMELEVLQYMKCARPLSALDETLGCLGLLWATGDGGKDEGKVGRSVEEKTFTAGGKWFDAISFQNFLGNMLVVCRNMAVHPIGTELP